MINIEHLLALIEKPSRYIDHEINACRKSFAAHPVRMLFAFPDLYELGVSHLGLKILYSIVNKLPYAMADRLYLPQRDLLELLKEENLPLFGLESREAAHVFDLYGITLQSELTFSNVLELIDKAHIPLFNRDRLPEHPIVMAGGPCATNPLPLAPFIDVFFFGEAEEGIVEIAEIMRDYPDRTERLQHLAALESCWVPQYHGNGPWDILIPTKPILSRKYADFHKAEQVHSPQLLSWQLATHNRYVSEIMRGCSRGCRFCHAGYFYRPVRERDPRQILAELLKEVQADGWDEAGLISLSSSDYTCIRELLFALLDAIDTDKTHISLPSLRVDSLDSRLVSLMQSLGREGLTIAPEAGSQRLRDVINKNLSEAEILQGVEIAKSMGWQKIKLYFMIGLPTETEADIREIIDLIHKINYCANKRMNISVTISPFTPKPFTPFQWAAMAEPDTLLKRAQFIKAAFIKNRNIKLKYHTIENSVLEACLTRGDLRMAKVLHSAWEAGALFDGWNESWDWKRWQLAFARHGLVPEDFTAARDIDAALAWDFVDIGVCKKFLKSEYEKAQKAELSPDCRDICTQCGVCNENLSVVNADADMYAAPAPAAKPRPQYDPHRQYRYRVFYRKTRLLRFISHLDWMRMLFRRIAVLELPTVFTMGFSPHPKVSLSPPLPIGVESHAEYFDISFYRPFSPDEILREFCRCSIPDFVLTACEEIPGKAALPESEYLSIELNEALLIEKNPLLRAFAQAGSMLFTKCSEKRSKTYDLKQIILALELNGDSLMIHKSLQSPSLYDVLAEILKMDKRDLFRYRVIRRRFGYPDRTN